jgi:hypothetical protein
LLAREEPARKKFKTAAGEFVGCFFLEKFYTKQAIGCYYFMEAAAFLLSAKVLENSE